MIDFYNSAQIYKNVSFSRQFFASVMPLYVNFV